MSSIRTRVCLWLCLVVLAMSAQALAWVTVEVTGDSITVDVDPDGTALVTHRLALRVRGGPLKNLSFRGIDADAEPLGEASIVRARAGVAAGYPIPLRVEREGELLKLGLLYKKGVRGGAYLATFSYRTALEATGHLKRSSDAVELSLDGLEFPDGVDTVVAEFFLPRGENAPTLPDATSQHGVELASGDHGVFLSQLRREADRDVLTVTRPHVARRERVRWTVLASPELFATAPARAEERPAAKRPLPHARPSQARAGSGLGYAALALGVGLLYSLLIALKWRWLVALAARTSARARFAVPLPLWARLPALALLAGAACAIALIWELPTWAAVVWLFGLGLGVMVPLPGTSKALGPGSWTQRSLTSELYEVARPRAGVWRLLDAGNWLGLTVFTAAAVTLAVVSLRWVGSAPYLATAGFVSASALLPVFFTLGSSAALRSHIELQRATLLPMAEQLQRARQPFTLMGRVAAKTQEVDAYRLMLCLRRQTPGLISFEIAAEPGASVLTLFGELVLIVKVQERTVAHEALACSLAKETAFFGTIIQWSRGQLATERVLLVKPRIPALGLTLDACHKLVMALHTAAPEGTGLSRRPLVRGRFAPPRVVTESARKAV